MVKKNDLNNIENIKKKFSKGQIITLEKEDEGLEPMKQWDLFEIEDIFPKNSIARLFCYADKKIRYVALDVLNKHFKILKIKSLIEHEDFNAYIDFNDYEKYGNHDYDCDCDKCASAPYICKYDENNEIVLLGVYEEGIDKLLNNAEIKVIPVFGKCVIVACKLENGFVITESSACVSSENYNEELGIKICMNKIKNRVWELEGYYLQKVLHDSDFV